MTETAVSSAPFHSHPHTRTIRKIADRDRAATPARAQAFPLWAWFPREILHRGGSVTRDDERAYRDLQAARDRSEW